MGKKKENALAKKGQGLWNDFKKFISRGSVVDLAVGVIMGGAFSAIVTAFTNILLSLCTWGVPGGLKGLVTVLPAANATQAGIAGIGQKFLNSDLSAMAQKYAEQLGGTYEGNEATWIASLKTLYTQHGDVWTYNQSAVIDWGTFINACITFLIIALTLFVVLKVYGWSKKKRAELAAMAQEEYYQRHPEERPVPPEPGKPAPTELSVLTEISAELKKLNAAKEEKSKE